MHSIINFLLFLKTVRNSLLDVEFKRPKITKNNFKTQTLQYYYVPRCLNIAEHKVY